MSKNRIHDLIMIILGNFVVACSVSFFILPNNILTGGVAGPVFRGLHHECLEAILRKS